MPNNIVSTIVGQRFYPGATALLADLPANSPITIEREPNNKYDANAIKVLVNNTQVGHIAKGDAAILSPLLDAGVSVSATLFPIAPVVLFQWEAPADTKETPNE